MIETSQSSEEIIATTTFDTRTFQGHKDGIACVDWRYDGCILASGSDDKTARLWDLRESGSRAYKCLIHSTPLEAVLFGLKNDFTFYTASGGSVYTFDLRAEGVLQKKIVSELRVPRSDEDDISAIALHPKKDFMAVGDDSGTVSIFPLESRSDQYYQPVIRSDAGLRVKRVSRMHTNVIGSLSFRPNSARDITTGGFDCLLCNWDFSSASLQNSVLFTSTSDGDQIFNPPFIHSVNHVFDGNGIIAALGDGTLRYVRCRDGATLATVEAHNGMINSMQAKGRTVISGGLDRALRLWKITGNDPAEEITTKMKGKGKKSSRKSSPSKEVAIMCGEVDESLSIVLQNSIDHGYKINCLTSNIPENLDEISICVGDTSCNLTLYTFR